jgi:hypothetical protein
MFQWRHRFFIDDKNEHMVFAYRDMYASIKDLSKEELRLAGLRIDPTTNIGSRVRYYNNLKIKHLTGNENEVIQVNGLPEKPKLTNFNLFTGSENAGFYKYSSSRC